MGPPGGARNPVTQRFLRHFNIMATLEFTDDTMIKIFSTLMSLSMRSNSFSNEIMITSQQIVSATLVVCYLHKIEDYL